MTQIIKELFFQKQPIHIFIFNDRVAFLAQQVGDILGTQKVSRSLRDSKILEEGVDFDIISSKSLELSTQNVLSSSKNAPQVAILYRSGL